MSLRYESIKLLDSSRVLRVCDTTWSFFFCSYTDLQAPDFFDLKLREQVHARETRFDMKVHDVHYPLYTPGEGQLYKRIYFRYLSVSILHDGVTVIKL